MNTKISEQLNNQAEELQRILSSISCGVIQHNNDTNELLLANEAALSILGYASIEEMIEDGFDDVAHSVVAEDRQRIREIIESLDSPDEIKSCEYRVVTKDGRTTYCYGSMQMFYNEKQERIIQRNIMDITERVEKSGQLQDMISMNVQMVEALSCGVLAYTLPERDILILNKEARRLFNYDLDRDKSFSDAMNKFINEEDLQELAKVTRNLKNVGDVCNYKYRIDLNNMTTFVECTSRLLAFEDGRKFILSVLQDVTEKEETKNMLVRERKQYRDAVISNGLFVFSYDVTEGIISEEVFYKDGRSFRDVFDIEFPIKYDELVKRWKIVYKPEMLTPHEQNQNTSKEILRHYEMGSAHLSCEYYLPGYDKYYRRIMLLSKNDFNDHVMAIVFANEITDIIRENSRKTSELAMINRNLVKQIEITKSFSSLYFATWEINLANNKMYEISVPEWARIIYKNTQGDFEEAVNIIVNEFVSTEYKHAMKAFLNPATLKERLFNERVLSYEYLSTFNGWCSANFIPSRTDGDGNAINVVYAVKSVDVEKRRELSASKALHEAYEAANRASAAKTDFLSSMSHDIRTPMNAIIGMTAIAKNHIDDTERVKDCLDKITVSSNHLLGLINEVLDMNKIESGKLELVYENISLSQLIDNIVTMSKPQMEEKNHNFTLVMGNVPNDNVIGDSMRIQQVFMNLMGNAIKYTPDGGEIKLSVNQRSTNNNRVGCYEFIFEDNGIGMSEEFLTKLFEPFSRAEDARIEKIQGTGLGMAITKNIVSMMNGNIKVESELGKGTKFTVTIFLKLQNEENAAHDDTPKIQMFEELQKKNFKGRRALLVEDNELNAEIATEILSMTGIEVETLENGKLAVDKIKEVESGYYDIIFMDIQMPVMNGYDATRKIRELPGDYAKNVPIIAMTANAFAEDVRASRNAGMNEHVAKPLDLEQLIATLENWVGGVH